MKKVALLLVAILTPFSQSLGSLENGIELYHTRRWSEAMDNFLSVLQQNPADAEAHAYVVLTNKQMQRDRESLVRARRLEILRDTTRMAHIQMAERDLLAETMEYTTHEEERAQQNEWVSACEAARLERQSGRLLPAADILLKVLAENDSFAVAQRELSELQSQMRRALDSGEGFSITERYAIEGFYAYAQADYAGAVAAWSRLHALAMQSLGAAEAAKRLEQLRILPYEAIAQRHQAQDERLKLLQKHFDEAVIHYQQKRFPEALEEFRNLAIQDPDYPQLGHYLVQTEIALEKDRTARLGETQQKEIADLLQRGLLALDQQHFADAKEAFERILHLDRGHARAHSYLAMASAEMERLHDPKAAQLHYETGLIAYASGQLDEAVREWRITARMNPSHEKARIALRKVQKELVLHKEEEMNDEALP